MDSRLEQIKMRRYAAKDGKWQAVPTVIGHVVLGPKMTWAGGYERREVAEFVAAAPGDVSYLLDVIEQMQRQSG